MGMVHFLGLSGLYYAPHLGVGLFSLFVFLSLFRVFIASVGLHRYFAHASFKLSKPAEIIIALLSTLLVQNPILWWVERHRKHHAYAGGEGGNDPHDSKRGFFYSHIGWLLLDVRQTDDAWVKDLNKNKTVYWFSKLTLPINLFALGVCYYSLSYPVFCLVFVAPILMSWHLMFSLNSICHSFGSRENPLKDSSTNVKALMILTMGESLHNNHHAKPRSVNFAFRKGEWDLSYRILKLLRVV